jgi:predicted ABC-type ATPase
LPGLANLPKALLLADKSWVFDNTQESGRRLVLSRQGEKVRKVSRTLPEWAAKAIPAPLRSFGKGRGIEH